MQSMFEFDPIQAFTPDNVFIPPFVPPTEVINIDFNQDESNLLGTAVSNATTLISDKKCNRWTKVEDNRLRKAVKKYGNR